MKKLWYKLTHPAKTKWFWGYIVLGILGILVSIFLMPVWPADVYWSTWGTDIINMIICACILLYLFLYLIKKILARTNSVVKILTIVEFVLLALIALGCVLQQFKVINITNGACAILGLAMWCRGVVEIFRAYFHQKGNNERYPIWWLAVAICLVSFGVYLFAKPLFSNLVILWIFIGLILLVSIILIVDGILSHPTKTKMKKQQKEE